VPKLDHRRFTFETIADAYDAVRTRKASGKIVIDVKN
jgi:hypothetical protein